MRWSSPSHKTKISRITGWHKWFAWHPVRINDTMVWLEPLQRQGTQYLTKSGREVWRWSYAELENV